jgi:hypothetical protein
MSITIPDASTAENPVRQSKYYLHMKNSFFILLLLVFSACQSTKIKKERYKVSPTTPELGSIGQSKSLFDLQNDFKVKTLPKLENNIRVAVELIPFNKRLNKIYVAKAKFNQNQSKVTYIDSLPSKPELVTIRLLDVTGFVKELNADYNNDVFRLLNDTQNSKVISSVAISLPTEDIAKIRRADSYYLTNSQDTKYILSLYKLGKKTETIDLNSGTVVSYRLSSFCWAATERGKWYIADMTEGTSRCKGNTESRINEKKKSKNLYRM